MPKTILCLDFDGVLHKYDSKWTTAAEIKDGAVDGAVDFIIQASKVFTVVVYSSRSHQEGGKDAMKKWLRDRFTEYLDNVYDPEMERFPLSDTFEAIQWPEEKPPAFITIDDRVLCFEGTWPDIQELLNFKPWNKRS